MACQRRQGDPRAVPHTPPGPAATASCGAAAKTVACTCRWVTGCWAAWSMPTASWTAAAARWPGAPCADDPPPDQCAMDRDPVRTLLDTGVRAINALLTVGRGSSGPVCRAPAWASRCCWLAMARYTAADVIVVGLIGERGREVKEFIEDILGDEGLARSVVVAAPADAPPLVRMQGPPTPPRSPSTSATKAGVLLLMDSLTAMRWPSARSPSPSANPRPPRAIRHELLRQAAAAGGTLGQRPERRGLDHRLLHRAQRKRRPGRT